MSNQTAATTYASRYGWRVFPVAAMGKVPLTKDGFKSATSDLDQIAEWWERWPEANLGIATGPLSGVWVLDVDDLDGLDSMVAEHGELPHTLTAQTGSGGQHWWFTHPDEQIANRAGFWPGLDVRGEGGYVVVPPSLHPNGNAYVWLTSGVKPVPAPDWLVDMVSRKARPAVEVGEVRLADTDSPWGNRVLSDELQNVAQALDGTRNDALNRSAFAVFGAVKGGQLPKDVAWQSLVSAALTAGLSAHEAERTIGSAWDGAAPRRPAERPAYVPSRPSLPSPEVPDVPERRWAIYDADDLHKIPPPQWIVEGYITQGLSVVYGPSGAGKSFLVVDWSLCAARGVTWLGTDVPQRPVVYVAAEGAGGLQSRVEAWKRHHTQAAAGMHVIPTRVNLLDAEDVWALEQDVKATDAGLVVIDTLARCMPGGDENSAQDVGRVIDAVDGIRARNNCGVILVHHSGVDGTRPRGSTALFGACDTVVMVEGKHDENTDALELVTVKCDKQKDARPFPRAKFVPKDSGPSVVLVESFKASRSGIR